MTTKISASGDCLNSPAMHGENRSAYHLNGIFGNSGANSNGTVHPGGKFSEKR